jgi:hypothetical protein
MSNIEYYEYSNFTDIQEIGEGAFGLVVRANWINGSTFALKSFNNGVRITREEVDKEVHCFESLIK